MEPSDELIEREMRSTFKAELPARIGRAKRVQLQQFIPGHWFAAAASECADMYIAGSFYGAISIAQAYVEALSDYLAKQHSIRGARNDPAKRWALLSKCQVVSAAASAAALRVWRDRNDFHHLDRRIEGHAHELEARATDCINDLHAIEREVFGYALERAALTLHHPERWPKMGPAQVSTFMRRLY